jgi:hypothetical protein
MVVGLQSRVAKGAAKRALTMAVPAAGLAGAVKGTTDKGGRRSRRGRRGRIRGAVRLVSAGLMVAAVVRELRRPKNERTWTGTLAGTIPYDLRRPSPMRLKRSMWSPDDSRIFVPRAFGVGWTVNLASVVSRVKQARADAR